MKEKKWKFNTKQMLDKPSPELELILKKIFEPKPELRPKMIDLSRDKWVAKDYLSVQKKCKQWMEIKTN